MASFTTLDKRMMRDVNQIHDFLWHSETKIDGMKLFDDLRQEARELDAFLGVGGKLRRNAEQLVRKTMREKDRFGGTLYELLYNSYNLTAATQHFRKKDFRGATEHVTWVVESDSIGTCVAVDQYPLVEEWEKGAIDFEAYAGKLADVLERKGIRAAGQYKRMLLVTATSFKAWDARVPKGQQALAALAAVHAAAWCSVASRAIRSSATGSAPIVPLSDYTAVVERIVSLL